MASRHPKEFREDMVKVARRHQTPINQIARDFGISDATLYEWMKKWPTSKSVLDPAQPRPRTRGRDPVPRNGLVRQGACPKMTYPLLRELAGDGIPVTLTCRILHSSLLGLLPMVEAALFDA